MQYFLILGVLLGVVCMIFLIIKTLYKREKIKFNLNKFLYGVGSISFIILLYTYLEKLEYLMAISDNFQIRNMFILLFLGVLLGVVCMIFEFVKTLYKSEKIKFNLNKFLYGVGSISFVIFLYKEFDDAQIRNIFLLLFLGFLSGMVGMIFLIIKTLYKREKIKFNLNKFLYGAGLISFIIFLNKYFDKDQIRNIFTLLFLAGGIVNILMSFNNDMSNVKKNMKIKKIL